MTRVTILFILSTFFLVACGGGAEEPATDDTAGAEAMAAPEPTMEPAEEAAPAETTEAVEATQPDAARLKAHFEQHVQYPIDRAGVLAACAQTEEFTAGEKAWVEQNLPEGEYESAEAVSAALGM